MNRSEEIRDLPRISRPQKAWGGPKISGLAASPSHHPLFFDGIFPYHPVPDMGVHLHDELGVPPNSGRYMEEIRPNPKDFAEDE